MKRLLAVLLCAAMVFSVNFIWLTPASAAYFTCTIDTDVAEETAGRSTEPPDAKLSSDGFPDGLAVMGAFEEYRIELPQLMDDQPDGFYLIGQVLYLSRDGYFMTVSGTGYYQGIPYTCEGRSGACSVDCRLLPLADGSVCVIENGTVQQDAGIFFYDGNLYCGTADGLLLQNDSRDGMDFGADGKYTSGNATIDAYITQIIRSETDSSMTQEERLRACYDYVSDHINYQPNNRHVPHGADESTWTEEYMLRLIERGKGNCYCFAAQMYYLARQLGYVDARAISGQDSPDGTKTDHGWLEIPIDGVPCLFDPEMNCTRYLAPGALFCVPYSEAPWKYCPK